MSSSPGLREADLDLLASARLGMLALNAAGLPLVSPVAYHYAAGAVWMTTSRAALKVSLVKRDPRAAFMVGAQGRHLLIQGSLEQFDPLSLSGQTRAILIGPSFYASLAGYALKNAAFIGGYLRDLNRIPRQWWPQNRVVFRLRPQAAVWMEMGEPPRPAAAELPSVPAPVGEATARTSVGYLCWAPGGRPRLAPALWAVRGDEVLAAFASGPVEHPRPPQAAALVVEADHPYRATRMHGVCVRGRLDGDPGAAGEVARRYRLAPGGLGLGLRLQPRRLTWWRGFEVSTRRLEAAPPATAAAGGRA